jgi:prophage maintenance system killer protein
VASAKDARPPGFPSLVELKALNQRIHDDAGTPERYKLDQPSALKSCLEEAEAEYADTPEGVIRVAARLAHGIAQAQAFVDGNRRTAYFATQNFLVVSGYGQLTETRSDHHLARYLNQVVEPANGKFAKREKFLDLFKRRLEGRAAPSDDEQAARP